MKVKTLGLPHQTVGFSLVAARMRHTVANDSMSPQEKLNTIKSIVKQLESMARENGKFYATICKIEENL